MPTSITVYGKEKCPFTQAALEDFKNRKIPVNYIDVQKDSEQLEIMLKHSDGVRKVPVILEGDTVSIGFRGRS